VIRTNKNGPLTYAVDMVAAAAYGGMPKRLYKNAIPNGDTGFIIAFLSTASEEAYSERATSEGMPP
jgi:hypothetical protein